MLNKIKGIGDQVATKANSAVGEIGTSVKKGVGEIANKTADLIDTAHESAVRTSTAQMCRMLEIAIDELKSGPLSAHPVSLTATVGTAVATLEMQIHLQPAAQENKNGGVLQKTDQ